MSLPVQTVESIKSLILSEMSSRLNKIIPILPKSFQDVVAKAIAGAFIILYKYSGFMFLQMFVRYASFEETEINGQRIVPLTLWGQLLGAGDPDLATQAELVIDITVTNQIGSLESYTQLINANNGITYLIIGDVLLNAPVVQATIRASSDQSGGDGSGSIGNLDIGDTVTFANSLANVQRQAVVSSQSVTGADAESEDAYRNRIIQIFQRRPQGGAYADYSEWALAVEGIISAYPYTGSVPGIVEVYCEATTESSGDPDGIPTIAQLNAVLSAVNLDSSGLASRRNTSVYPIIYPITRTQFDVEVYGLDGDDIANLQSLVTSAISEYFLDREPYIPGLSIPPRKDRITSSGILGVIDDVVSANNGIFTTIILKEGAFIIDEIRTLGNGEKAKGSVTFPS